MTTEALFSQWALTVSARDTGFEISVCRLIQFGAKAKNFWSLPALSSTGPIYGARVKKTCIKFGNLGITLESWWFWIILLKQSLWDTAPRLVLPLARGHPASPPRVGLSQPECNTSCTGLPGSSRPWGPLSGCLPSPPAAHIPRARPRVGGYYVWQRWARRHHHSHASWWYSSVRSTRLWWLVGQYGQVVAHHPVHTVLFCNGLWFNHKDPYTLQCVTDAEQPG